MLGPSDVSKMACQGNQDSQARQPSQPSQTNWHAKGAKTSKIKVFRGHPKYNCQYDLDNR